MLITPITKNFYQISNALSENLLAILSDIFATDKTDWLPIPDGRSAVARMQYRPEFNLVDYAQLGLDVGKELAPALELAKELTGVLYPNNLQLWHDNDGYINTIHNGDVSPNHQVNVQIYLTDGNKNMGTYCYDEFLDRPVNAWHSVPYQRNCGYMMLNPTRVPHGMKHHVVGQRASLYQSFRCTEIPSDIW